MARLQHEPSDLDQLRGVLPPPGTGPVSGAKGIALKTGIKRIADADPIDNDLVLIPGRHVAPAALREDKDALNFLQLPEPSPAHCTATHRWASDPRSGLAFWWSHMWIYFAGPSVGGRIAVGCAWILRGPPTLAANEAANEAAQKLDLLSSPQVRICAVSDDRQSKRRRCPSNLGRGSVRETWYSP